MPGVYVTTALSTGPSNPVGPTSSAFFIVGIADRGPVDKAVRVQSITDYVSTFGNRSPVSGVLYDQVATFFQEGGSLCYVGRVVGPAATSATLALKDRSAAPGVNTLQVTPKNGPGTWGSEISVAVTDGAVTGFTLAVYSAGVLVESFPNLPDPATAVQVVGGSAYITLTNLGSATAGPGNNPAVLAATPLAGGTSDRPGVTTAVVTAVPNLLFGKGLGPGAIAIPGYTADLIGPALVAHCVLNRRIAILAGSATADGNALKNLRSGLQASAPGASEYWGIFGPWVTIPDGAGSRNISPEGYVAGVRARAQTLEGFWQPPAGARAGARFVIGTAFPVDQTAGAVYAGNGVNSIETYNNTVRLFGWYSGSDSLDYQLLSARDFLNVIAYQSEIVLDPYVWETIDGRGQLLSAIEGALKGILQPIADADGLFALVNDDGDVIDPGFSVVVNAAANAAQLGSNRIMAAIGVRLSPSAATILIQITKTALTSTL